MQTVIITVSGGVAEVFSAPPDTEVHILDFDNLEYDGLADDATNALDTFQRTGETDEIVNLKDRVAKL